MADDRRGGALLRSLVALGAEGVETSSHEQLKRVPPPFPQDHPRSVLLIGMGLAITLREIPEDQLRSPELVEWLTAKLVKAKPFVQWLEEVVSGQ